MSASAGRLVENCSRQYIGAMNPVTLSAGQRQRLTALAPTVVRLFTDSDWTVLGAKLDALDMVRKHDRLLRSLSFGDPDYEGHVYTMLFRLSELNGHAYHMVTSFIEERYGDHLEEGDAHVSTTKSKSRKVTFAPSVFDLPKGEVEEDLVAVMSPFAPQFETVFQAIQHAAQHAGFRALRAKDIWEHSAVIQDIFSLIYRAQVVVCDFSGKNSNVFYEAGIAHTLGKLVIPITQSSYDIPFDIQHHRYLAYLPNTEGINELSKAIYGRLSGLKAQPFGTSYGH